MSGPGGGAPANRSPGLFADAAQQRTASRVPRGEPGLPTHRASRDDDKYAPKHGKGRVAASRRLLAAAAALLFGLLIGWVWGYRPDGEAVQPPPEVAVTAALVLGGLNHSAFTSPVAAILVATLQELLGPPAPGVQGAGGVSVVEGGRGGARPS